LAWARPEDKKRTCDRSARRCRQPCSDHPLRATVLSECGPRAAAREDVHCIGFVTSGGRPNFGLPAAPRATDGRIALCMAGSAVLRGALQPVRLSRLSCCGSRAHRIAPRASYGLGWFLCGIACLLVVLRCPWATKRRPGWVVRGGAAGMRGQCPA
jgi:hypothetical protein